MADSRSTQTSRKRPSGFLNINHLPDAILHHVLSFLPTNEAVATSVLSKRWRSLWTLVPVLDFQDSPGCKNSGIRRKAFGEFVYRVLILNKVASLDKFRLDCDINHGSSCLNTWIDGAIRRGFVREVDISISSTQKTNFFRLPSCLFTVKNLKFLKLSHRILIDVPSSRSVSFPSLKILHLLSVKYANSESVRMLFRGCTVLEELIVKRSFEDNARNFIISVPTLKTLNISLEFDKKIRSEFVSHGYKLTINAPNLEYLEITDLKSLVHLESVFNSLIKANIYFNGTGLFQLAEALCNAKFLCLKWITCHDNRALLKDDFFPLFLNLTQLELNFGFDGWDVIPNFLENSHNLQVLVLNKPQHLIMKRKERVPKDLSPHLTKVYGRGFRGHEDELEMVEYLLKNATALELVEICSFEMMSLDSKICMLQKFLKFPRRSQKCQLTFN